MPGLPIVGIEMSIVCILGIEMPSSVAFIGIVTFGLSIVGIETTTFSVFRYCEAYLFSFFLSRFYET